MTSQERIEERVKRAYQEVEEFHDAKWASSNKWEDTDRYKMLQIKKRPGNGA